LWHWYEPWAEADIARAGILKQPDYVTARFNRAKRANRVVPFGTFGMDRSRGRSPLTRHPIAHRCGGLALEQLRLLLARSPLSRLSFDEVLGDGLSVCMPPPLLPSAFDIRRSLCRADFSHYHLLV
jgi:hypothetical protein